ncbi:hypothetical protein [Enterococcus sp. BWR-S5]|uniref:hypothetical protein n=1 Tax=Enterococcus sp. BWR-S5 TaxID=2787714 RepID=UPI00192348D0|nr:hypothetical protein [Enterococcus sp. BWR-S5]MBL1225842.1 hypothetical protein [Enterococcus sp. BWR-S5]
MNLKKEIILSLCTIDFLSHTKDLNIPFEYPKDLKDAAKSINNLQWENLCLEEIGNVTAFLSKNHKELYKKTWNELAIEIKKQVIPTIEKKLTTLIEEQKILKEMINQILFDIINIALYKSYDDIYTSEFYDLLSNIYQSGYIPCGWNGQYPKGTIKVI